MKSTDPINEQECVISAQADQKTLVFAGPGTGKTETVARRLVHLIGKEGLRPSEILVLSFSRSAVKALVSRIRSLDLTDVPTIEELRYVTVRTFDSWTFRMLRFLGEDAGELLKNEYEENIELLISWFDEMGCEGSLHDSNLRLDKIRHFIVDEFQDLAGARAELVQKLLSIFTSEKHPDRSFGFTILGDPNQAIYDFSLFTSDYSGDCGTSRDLTRWISEEFPDLKTVRFTKNRRSSVEIAELVEEAAEILIESQKDGSDPVEQLEEFLEDHLDATDTDELFESLVRGDEDGLAVLCRSNSQILELLLQMDYLAFKKNKPIHNFYLTAGTPPGRLPSWVAKLLFQYTGSSVTRNKFQQIFGLVFPAGSHDAPCGGDVEAAWQLLLGYARSGDGQMSLDMRLLRTRIHWPDSLPDDEALPDTQIALTTIHQSKGLEYRKVRIVKGDGSDSEISDPTEEGRVLFVGMSRAKDDLAILEFPGNYPFFLKNFEDGRKRWQRWTRKGMTQLELGCDGDVDEQSVIRADYMGGDSKVKQIQKYLAENERKLVGRKVCLVKTPIPGVDRRFIYAIREGEDGDGHCLGYLRQFIWKDIYSLRSAGKKGLPPKIKGLRIGAVSTSCSDGDLHRTVPSPWRESKFWLTVTIHGIGSYY